MDMSNPQRTHSEIIDLSLESFQSIVIDDPSPILIDFWAPWCGPCRMMTPILHQAADLLRGIARVAKVNVDEQPQLSDAFGIRGIPALVLISGGKVVAAASGVMAANDLANLVRAKLGK